MILPFFSLGAKWLKLIGIILGIMVSVVRHLRTRHLRTMSNNSGLAEARKIILAYLDSAKKQLSIHIKIINYS
jgi:hypothetical protein